MNEFVYSIKEVFSSVLGQCSADYFYIAPYQRGYKWASFNVYDQVPRMLIDFYDAFKSTGLANKEYYLQYLTLMRRKVNGDNVLEVIDGQQRLTTLSILLYSYSQMSGTQNVAANLVNYSRYDNGNIFDKIVADVDGTSVYTDEEIESQDRYYMVRAMRCIMSFLELLEKESELGKYMDFVLNNVKLIINLESEFVKPEEVFSNLNDNKVELTNAELIKGLLLTYASRTNNSLNVKRSYADILNQRAIMGRQWDEISAWIEQPDVCHFFFGAEPGKGEHDRNRGFELLLGLVDLPQKESESTVVNEFSKQFCNREQSSATKSRTELFDRFNESVDSPEKAQKVLSEIKHIYNVLHDIYVNEDFTLYNLLGYYFFSTPKKTFKERATMIISLLCISEDERIKTLKRKISSFYRQLPALKIAADSKDEEKAMAQKAYEDELKKYSYSSYNPLLTNLLLSFSVFPEEKNSAMRFDFCSYDREKWSFEHIFPQHPAKEEVTINEVAREVVCSAIVKKHSTDGKEGSVSDSIKAISSRVREKGKLKLDADTDFLYSSDITDVDVLGNMALLSGGVNSALSNNPFIAKRPILSRKNKNGNFIPYHTLGIFSKVFDCPKHPFNIELTTWDDKDIEAHTEWMKGRNADIVKFLSDKR